MSKRSLTRSNWNSDIQIVEIKDENDTKDFFIKDETEEIITNSQNLNIHNLPTDTAQPGQLRRNSDSEESDQEPQTPRPAMKRIKRSRASVKPILPQQQSSDDSDSGTTNMVGGLFNKAHKEFKVKSVRRSEIIKPVSNKPVSSEDDVNDSFDTTPSSRSLRAPVIFSDSEDENDGDTEERSEDTILNSENNDINDTGERRSERLAGKDSQSSTASQSSKEFPIFEMKRIPQTREKRIDLDVSDLKHVNTEETRKIIHVRDNLNDPAIINEYEIFSGLTVKVFINIIKLRHAIDTPFQIYSKNLQLGGDLQIEEVLEEYGKIPLRIQKCNAEHDTVDESDEEQFHIVFQKGDGRNNVFKVNCDETEKLLQIFEKTKWPPASFRFDGDNVDPTSTIAALGMESGDIVEVI